MRDLVPLALLALAVGLAVTGLPDSLGFPGASRGLAIGAAICFPIFILGRLRRSGARRTDVSE